MRLKAEANWIGRASAEGDVGRNERSEWHRCLGRASGGKRGDGRKVEVITRMSEYAALFAPAGHDSAGTK